LFKAKHILVKFVAQWWLPKHSGIMYRPWPFGFNIKDDCITYYQLVGSSSEVDFMV